MKLWNTQAYTSDIIVWIHWVFPWTQNFRPFLLSTLKKRKEKETVKKLKGLSTEQGRLRQVISCLHKAVGPAAVARYLFKAALQVLFPREDA